MKQIVGCANKLKTNRGNRVGLEVCPFSGNQGLASVRQDQNELQSALPVRMSQDFQRLSLERVMRTGDGHPLREVLTVGSVWRFPSTRFRTTNCKRVCGCGSRIVRS